METLEQFSIRMSEVEKSWEHTVGRAYQGHTRAHFVFEGNSVFNESLGFRTPPNTRLGSKMNPLMTAIWMTAKEPYDYWWTGYMSYGKQRAKRIAKYYNAELEESPYAEETGKWFHYTQMQWDDLMRFCYDRYTGKFLEMWGKEEVLYQSCIAGDEPSEIV